MRSRHRAIALLTVALAACDAHVPSLGTTREGPHASPPPSAASGEPTVGAQLSSTAAPKPRYVPAPPPDPPIALTPGGKKAVKGTYGAVTSVEHNATRIGVEVLKKGGNAVDAAVAIGYALAVTHPSAGNIGGGGFMMVRLATGEVHAVDFREAAPAVATTERILTMLKDDAAVGWRSPGVPGTVAGLNLVRERFGSRPLAELIEPAAALARKGHKLGARQGLVLSWAWPKLQNDPQARAIYGRGGKAPLKHGQVIKQPELARTLESIAKEGDRAFYESDFAKKLDEAMRKNGGYITADDMRAYKAKVRKPLRFSYRGFTVDTMPPPSMGGIAFAEIMLTLERVRAYEAPVDSGIALHFFVEAARRAYSERRLVGGDPDFLDASHAPLVARLLDPAYLAARLPAVDRDRATPSTELAPKVEVPTESQQTTHFSVVDAAGNAVACTYTQSAGFGSKIVVPGTGVLLGNALGGFSESGVNTVSAGKRMSSSMTPAIVTHYGKLALILGSPGGDTIPNIVAQVFRNLVDYGMTIDIAVTHPRVHHQFLPDKIRVEKLNSPPQTALDDLARRGHTLDLDTTPLGDANDILVEPNGTAWAAADGREGGKAEGLMVAPSPPKN